MKKRENRKIATERWERKKEEGEEECLSRKLARHIPPLSIGLSFLMPLEHRCNYSSFSKGYIFKIPQTRLFSLFEC